MGDLIDRQRLLTSLQELKAAWEKYPVMTKAIKGVEAAIDYTKTIPSVAPPTQPNTFNALNALDCISRQAAIDAICKACSMEDKCDGYPETSSWCDEFVTLRALPPAQPEERTNKRTETHACDLISRQQAISRAVELRMFDRPVKMVAVSELERLPSAEPERKKGRWVYNSPATMKCNQCGLVIKDWDWHRFKYCPNCISDMRGE